MTVKARTWVDIDANFRRHPLTNDVVVRFDAAAVSASIRNLVLTMYGERLFQPEIGSPLKRLLFELHGSDLQIVMKKSIEQTIDQYEPRAVLLDVVVDSQPDSHNVIIVVTYRIKDSSEPITVQVALERTR